MADAIASSCRTYQQYNSAPALSIAPDDNFLKVTATA
jgi:hypothetical protein